MISWKVHTVLNDIAKMTFPEVKIRKFYVKIEDRELKTKHGDYEWNRVEGTHTIRTFNLSRKSKVIVKTSVHELAHHVEVCMYEDTGHSKRFYEIYKRLLEVSVKMGILTYEDIRSVRDIKILEKHCGAIEVQFDPSMEYKKDKINIKVFNSYSIKDILSSRGYKYSGMEQAWCKEIDKNTLDEEKEYLSTIIDSDNIKVYRGHELAIEARYYVIVGNSYNYKEILKDNGYIYKGYNQKGNVWVKKIRANQLDKEKELLSTMQGIEVKVKGVSKKRRNKSKKR